MTVRHANIGFGLGMFAIGGFMLLVAFLPPIQPATAGLFCMLALTNFYNGYAVMTSRG